jgi:hypothetical protein
MGWQGNILSGFGKSKTRKTVVERKKIRRLAVRAIVKDLKAAGKPIDLQAINQAVVNTFKRKKQSHKSRIAVIKKKK